ncbi:unnamed protein product [Auanema sp. JU1783]|nr:unnamed protein product [Auanema sp. JU1783]
MLVLLIISTFLHFINFALMIWVGRKEKKKIAKIVEQTAREISRRLKLQAVPSERIGSQSIMMESNEETTDFNST